MPAIVSRTFASILRLSVLSLRSGLSYGMRKPGVQRIAGWALAACTLLLTASVHAATAPSPAAPASPRTIHVVALGDSLTAGYGLPQDEGFVPVLQKALREKGYRVEIANAGVSGDTAAGGLERLAWSVPDGTDAVLLELGANDMLRGLDPAETKKALGDMLRQLRARQIPVFLIGMRAAPNMGTDYRQRFDAIYPDLARQYGVPLYPFFLDGVAAHPDLNQKDGMHPTPAGVKVIVARILPAIEAFLQPLANSGVKNDNKSGAPD